MTPAQFDAQVSVRFLTLVGHDNYLSAVAVSPSGLRLVTASWDSTVCLWETASGRLLRRWVRSGCFVELLRASLIFFSWFLASFVPHSAGGGADLQRNENTL